MDKTIKQIYDVAPNALKRAVNRCRELGITKDQLVAITAFLVERKRTFGSGLHRTREERVESSALFDYACGLKSLEDKADQFRDDEKILRFRPKVIK